VGLHWLLYVNWVVQNPRSYNRDRKTKTEKERGGKDKADHSVTASGVLDIWRSSGGRVRQKIRERRERMDSAVAVGMLPTLGP